MYDNVYYAAQSHYAGDITALCYDPSGGDRYNLNQNEINAIINAAEVSEIKPKYTVKRTMMYDGANVFFNGNAIPLKYVIGCDWEKESFLFNKMTNVNSGAFESVTGDDSIILSLPTAEMLGARVGDSVVLEIGLFNGMKNTGIFIVKGIVQEASIFGYYKAYISRLSLNHLKLYDDEACSTIGFFFDNPGLAEKKRNILQKILSEYIQTGQLVYNRNDDEDKARKGIADGRAIFLYTLPVYLSELSSLLDAMNIIAYIIYGMMLLIIMVSTAVTYRLILHERAKEIGIMRTVGFLGGDLRLILFAEIIILGTASIVAGIILARIISFAVSFLSFSWIPSFEIFMKNGKLIPVYLVNTSMINIIIIIGVLFFLVLFPSLKIAGMKIQALLSGEAI
jgi:ABC-type lipoprotein release transport system permease subunit